MIWHKLSLIGVLALLTACGRDETLQTLVYARGLTEGGGIDLVLDFYAPDQECAGVRPTIVFIHGGSFADGSRRNGEDFADIFADKGFNFASIDYRKVPDAPIPSPAYVSVTDRIADQARISPDANPAVINAAAAAFEDTVRALEYLRAHSEALCHDPSRVILMGVSAGGVTALNVAYALDNHDIPRPPVAGVINNCGAFLRDDAMRRGDIPLLHFHSEDDEIVPFSAAELIWAQSQATNTAMQFLTFRQEGHCPDIHEAESDGRVLAQWAMEFAQDIAAGKQPISARTSN